MDPAHSSRKFGAFECSSPAVLSGIVQVWRSPTRQSPPKAGIWIFALPDHILDSPPAFTVFCKVPTKVSIEVLQQITLLLHEGWVRKKSIGLVPADKVGDVGAVEAGKDLLYWQTMRVGDLNLDFWGVRRLSYKRANLSVFDQYNLSTAKSWTRNGTESTTYIKFTVEKEYLINANHVLLVAVRRSLQRIALNTTQI